MKQDHNLNKRSRLRRAGVLMAGAALLCAQSAFADITIKDSSVTLQEALNAVKKQGKVYVMYENGTVNGNQRLKLNLDNASVQTAMGEICRQAGLKYELKGNYVLLTRKSGKSQSGRVTGRVTDQNGAPLLGVTVVVEGKARGAVSDADGFYMVAATPGEKLKFRYVGMRPVEYRVDGDEFNPVMEIDEHNLDAVQVVSTGYATLPRERATGSYATVSASDLKKVPTPNVVQRLEGQVPGLKIDVLSGDRSMAYTNTLQSANSSTRTRGAADYNMSIRGVSSLTGERMPLLVVDGVISESDMSSIDPNSIENISVLKDAAAASIWGARAANGVIVITTKKGERNSRPRVSFGASLTVQDKPDMNYLNQMTSAQVLEYEKDLVYNNLLWQSYPGSYYGASPYFSEGVRMAFDLKSGAMTQAQYDARVKELSAISNYDQIGKYVFQKASSQQYNVSVSGGNSSASYFYSVGYAKENPYSKGDDASRLTLNVNNSWKLFNWATLSTRFGGTFFNYNKNGFGLQQMLCSNSVGLMPYMNIADANGKGIDYDMLHPDFIKTLGAGFKPWTYNFLDEMALADNSQSTDNYTANINLELPLVWGISSNTTVGFERSYTSTESWRDPQSYSMRNIMNYYTPPTGGSNSLGLSNGALIRQHSDNRNWTFRQQFNYNANYGGIHSVSAIAGVEMRQTYVEQDGYTLWGYNRENGIIDTKINMSYTGQYDCVAGYKTSFNEGGYPDAINRKRRFLSYYGNAGYTLLDRYSVSGSLRYDDYNNFGLDRKYRAKPFWSVGGKWTVNREEFMDEMGWVNNLALRATYGLNGNINLDSYPFTKISFINNYLTGQPSASISALANPQLKWEETYNTNIGVDFSLFHYRLTGSVDYYLKHGKDLVYSFPFSSTIVGNIYNSTMTRNVVGIKGHGLDVNLQGIVYEDRDWNFTIGGNLSYNENTVTENPFFVEAQNASTINQYPIQIGMIGGYPVNKIFAYRFAGLNDKGAVLVYDRNGKELTPSDNISELADLKFVGSSVAPVYGGINLSLKWKDFVLYSLFTYQTGGYFFKPTFSGWKNGSYTKWDLSSDIADRWRKPGDEAFTNVPGMSTDRMASVSVNRYKFSDINIEKSDYIRWRQLSLTYNLVSNALSRLGVSSANITASVSNIGLIWKANKSGYDPDFVSGVNATSLPGREAYSISFNVNF